jgi:hypothetical protein
MDIFLGNFESAVVRHPFRAVVIGFLVGFTIGWVLL